MSTKKKCGIWAAVIVFTPILLIALLTLLLYLPPVQNWAVKRVAAYASESTGMDITVKHVELVFPLRLGVEGVKACDYEFRLPKPSYTWNTLQHLSKDYPDYQFSLLIGGDNWAHFQRWRNWQEIMEHHDIIVYPRDSYPGTIDVPLFDVSSTEIRQRVRAGESIEGMVPKAIVPLVKKFY